MGVPRNYKSSRSEIQSASLWRVLAVVKFPFPSTLTEKKKGQ